MDLQSVSLYGKIMDPQKLKNICHNLPTILTDSASARNWKCAVTSVGFKTYF